MKGKSDSVNDITGIVRMSEGTWTTWGTLDNGDETRQLGVAEEAAPPTMLLPSYDAPEPPQHLEAVRGLSRGMKWVFGVLGVAISLTSTGLAIVYIDAQLNANPTPADLISPAPSTPAEKSLNSK